MTDALVRAGRFVRLFRWIFGPGEELDPARIEEMGLLAVKVAQLYAARGDLLGPEKAAKLSKLYERATPMADGEFRRVFEEVAPAALREALEELDDEPLAVASLGQVHRARLRDGSEVVVKLLRADHVEDFERDLAVLRRMVRGAVFFYPPLRRLADPEGTLAAIEETTRTEMDLSAEIRGTRRLEEVRAAGEGEHPQLRQLSFPRIHEEFTTPSIMVADFIDAPSVSELLERDAFDYDALLLLFRLHGWFLFFRGSFHGDLHPGNLMFRDGRFWWIDNANVEEVSTGFGRGLLEFMVCLGREDYRRAGEAIARLSVVPLPDHDLFIKRFEGIYADFGGRPIGEQSLTTQMMRTVRMAVESGLEFPAGAFPVIKSLMYLDGIAVQCAPEKTLLDDVARFASELDGDASGDSDRDRQG